MFVPGFVAILAMLGGCAEADPSGGSRALDTKTEVPADVPTEEPTEEPTERERTAESASALQSKWYCIAGSCVSFESYGDHLFIQDTSADGHSAVGQILGYGTCWNPNGAGTTVDCNFDTAETDIYFRPCIGEYGPRQILACSSVWVKFSAKN